VAMLAGVGFTVALLVAELSFAKEESESAKTAVLMGSVLAAGLASVMLKKREKTHKNRSDEATAS
jgi:NhaA family Na+:H+ antiporter